MFRIDHDEHFNQTTHLQYQPWKRGPWIGFNWRYDSGLVAGAVPCFGGEACANGPGGGGPNDLIDVSGITPDQQFQAGLFCGNVYATPTTPISSSAGANLCPAANMVEVPLDSSAGHGERRKNPPRIAPRNLFDLAVGHDNLFHGDRYKWSLRLTAINITNKTRSVQFPFDLQWNALRYAAELYGGTRFSLLKSSNWSGQPRESFREMFARLLYFHFPF